jgi:uncharacterized repeat protein (TIGR02543 family)
MKKLVYSLTILCLMFFGITGVNAKGSVTLDKYTLDVTEGGSATFKIIVDNALARANISSSNTAVLTVKENGLWVSDGNGKGKTIEHTITVNAVGKAGTTAKVIVEVFDASTYDGESLATKTNVKKHEVTVNVVAASVTPTPTPKTYTVTFNANGGKGGPSAQTKTEGVDLTLSNSKPTRDKYVFVEWNTKSDGSGASYSPSGKYRVDANITLYAIWNSTTNVDKNPQTGDNSLLIIMAIIITFGGYAYWYTKKSQEN